MAQLTKTDIINTAFRTWGRDFYQQTSLSLLARNLGVTKAALYRHFKNKQALLDAMYESFFTHYTAFIKPGYIKALETADLIERQFIMMRTIVEYYARNMDAFIFSLFMVYGRREAEQLMAEWNHWGIDMRKIRPLDEEVKTYPPMLQLILVSLTFWVASFHKHSHAPDEPPSDEQVHGLIRWIEAKIAGGLGLRRDIVERINFEELEKALPRGLLDTTEDEGLLKAVAGAVAEAGPWNATMAMVARRSGLSKSGLYAHFKNKQDMLGQLFLTEFERIVTYAEAAIRASAVPEEQFYLAIAGVADYLRSRPEILTALDWLRTRRIDPGCSPPPRIYRIFLDIKIDGNAVLEGLSESLKEQTSQWILFLTANVLMRWPKDRAVSEFPNKSLRTLYKFIALGINGYKSCYQ
ncbi:MAG: TetR/AcrR family transcriptional regulator [Spirochaetaceae bacterium]|jgi:AcrR family transcriptional regulator|nr:TetR/AcrR family transcriptional regulator [Spirochaetaceae bacterium]